jgi:SAM-dependent methyltransferase
MAARTWHASESRRYRSLALFSILQALERPSSRLAFTAHTMASEEVKPSEEEVFKLAPFNPSSEQIQEKAMELLHLTENDILFDLGCGDGRLLVAAAKRYKGLKCVGVEIDPVFSNRAKELIETLPDDVKNRVDIREQDVLKLPMTLSENDNDRSNLADLTLVDDATALYLFILPKGINKIMPLLDALVAGRLKQKRSFRVLSYMFKIHDWEPTVKDTTSKGGCPVYLYEFGAPTGE